MNSKSLHTQGTWAPASARTTAKWFLSAAAGLTLALLSAVPAQAAEGDFAEIRGAVLDYFEGINEVNRERLERAFDPGAELKNVDADGALVSQPIAEVIERWMSREPAERRGEILSIDVTDSEIARVVFDYNGAYLDFLTLARVKGQWKIIDKVFVTR